MPNKTKHLTLVAMLFALSIVLAIIEGMLPAPNSVPGVKLGLSNIVVMFTLLNLKKTDAVMIAFLKSGFVLLTRGTIAGLLSLSGGLSSVIVMSLLLVIFRGRATYVGLSVLGAIFHNLGQVAVASLILETSLWFYFPVLLISGIISGVVTSVVLRVASPLLLKLHLK